MKNIANLKNWIEVLEVSNNIPDQIKTFLDTNLDSNFTYELNMPENDTDNDNDNYSLLTSINITITDKNNPNMVKTLHYNTKNLPSVLEIEESDRYDDDEYAQDSYYIYELSNEEKAEILKEYEDLINKITTLDLQQITNQMTQNTKSGLSFLQDTIYLQDNNLVFITVPVNQAKMILKDDILYFLKGDKVDNYDQTYLDQLDYIDLKELKQDDMILLPALKLTQASYNAYTRDKHELNYNTLHDVINVDGANKRFSIHNINGLDGWIFNSKALDNPNTKNEYVKYYQKDIDAKNKDLIKAMNKQGTNDYGTFARHYPTLNKEALLDMMKIWNWRRAISIKDWQLEQITNEHTYSYLGNHSIESYNEKIRALVNQYKALGDTNYQNIDYSAIMNEFKDEHISKDDYFLSNAKTVRVALNKNKSQKITK